MSIGNWDFFQKNFSSCSKRRLTRAFSPKLSIFEHLSPALERLGRDDIDVRTENVLREDRADLDRALRGDAVEQRHALEHFFLWERLVGLDRQARHRSALYPDGRGDDADRVLKLVSAVDLTARTAVARYLIAVFLIYRKVAALGAGNADNVGHACSSSTDTVTAPCAFSSRTRGSLMFSISPGAICSRRKDAI